jgi:hypothetical protein
MFFKISGLSGLIILKDLPRKMGPLSVREMAE